MKNKKIIKSFETFKSLNENFGYDNYNRVIPRDFFNEAKLLKCMGNLAVKILDFQIPEGINIVIEDSGDPFHIVLTDDGSLMVSNYNVTVNGEDVIMKSTYNSKENFPFFCEIDDEEYKVFTDQGEFDKEFIERFQNSEE